jgi:hypothetical protein
MESPYRVSFGWETKNHAQEQLDKIFAKAKKCSRNQ